MHRRTLTLLPAAAFLVALVPQATLAQPASRPPGRTPNAVLAADQHAATPATSSQPSLGFTVAPTTVAPGEQVVLAGAGCRPGERVGLQWRPYPETASFGHLAPTTARGDGSFRRVWKAPLGLGQIAVSAWCGKRYSREVVLTILSRPGALPRTGSRDAMLLILAGALLAAGAGALWAGRTRPANQRSPAASVLARDAESNAPWSSPWSSSRPEWFRQDPTRPTRHPT
jgi:LPXTG-motif cell wall-anchored protein